MKKLQNIKIRKNILSNEKVRMKYNYIINFELKLEGAETEAKSGRERNGHLDRETK